MKITVVGTGYVGLIAGVCFADFGNDVLCVENNVDKLAALRRGECPIYEPGVNELLRRNMAEERIHFTGDMREGVAFGELIFITVGTPEDAEGNADLRYVFETAAAIGDWIDGYRLVVDKSTVPVGTSREVGRIIRERMAARGVSHPFDVASNPEFLREGKSVSDFLNPDRIVLGVGSARAERLLRELYQVFVHSNKPMIVTTPETAEMIKYVTNSFLATKIAFINEVANLCEQVGANVLEVARTLGMDGRISPKYLHPGPGYGGSCFPKDTKAIARTARQYGVQLSIVESAIAANERQKRLAAAKIERHMPEGGVLAVLGLSFKPETDDVRESPAVDILRQLAGTGRFRFRLYDPQAMDNARLALAGLPGMTWCRTRDEALSGADAAAIVTEWAQFRSLEFDRLARLMRGRLLFDFRNIYCRADAEQKGFTYVGTGV